jgi:hypothetical protein
MLNRYFVLKSIAHYKLLIISQLLFLTMFGVHFFSINGLKKEEYKKLTITKNNYSLITTKTDKRRGNIFFSTTEFFLSLSNMVPNVEAFIKSDPISISFSYPEKGKSHTVVRELPLTLIGAGYFDAFNGRFIQGRGFKKSEVYSGKPYVILTEKALVKIFGDYDTTPSVISINGIQYQIIGVWAFDSSDVAENESLFLPISLTPLFGKEESTYINNYLYRGNDSQSITKLKQAIDKIQLNAGFTPLRPEFSFEGPQISRRTEYIFSHNKAYIDLIVWVSLFLFFIISLVLNNDYLNFKHDWAIWTLMASGKIEAITKRSVDIYFLNLILSLGGSFFTVLAITLFLKTFIKMNMATGSEFHLSIILYFVFLPIQIYLNKMKALKLRYTRKSFSDTIQQN